MNDIKRDMILNLPVSVRSWIILNDYIKTHGDLEVFKKIIREYSIECPFKVMLEIFRWAERYFTERDISELFNLYLQISITEIEK